MTTRYVAAAMLLGAMLLYLGVALPSRRLAADAADEYKRARDERREIRTRLLHLERRDQARRRAASVIQSSPASAEETVRLVRRSVVQALGVSGVGGARLGVRPGRAGVGAFVQVSAVGRFADVMRLSAEVARPETGVVLNEVRIRPVGAGASLDIQGLGFGVRP